MSLAAALELFAPPGLPMIRAGDDLAAILGDALAPHAPRDGDVVVVAQKIVSKAEGRMVEISSVTPGEKARALAAETGKDPRLVQIVLDESRRVVRHRTNLLIVEDIRGFVMANAGVDQSNVAPPDGSPRALLLPRDPDASAEALRAALTARFDAARLAVVINDSFGRAWRRGTVGVAIGAAGLPALLDLRGRPDLFGRTLEVSIVAFADEIAAAASLLMGQGAEARPVVLVRGLNWTAPANPAAALIRAPEEDLFR